MCVLSYDGTYDRIRPLLRLRLFEEGCPYSFDLKSSTDRRPLSVDPYTSEVYDLGRCDGLVYRQFVSGPQHLWFGLPLTKRWSEVAFVVANLWALRLLVTLRAVTPLSVWLAALNAMPGRTRPFRELRFHW